MDKAEGWLSRGTRPLLSLASEMRGPGVNLDQRIIKTPNLDMMVSGLAK